MDFFEWHPGCADVKKAAVGVRLTALFQMAVILSVRFLAAL